MREGGRGPPGDTAERREWGEARSPQHTPAHAPTRTGASTGAAGDPLGCRGDTSPAPLPPPRPWAPHPKRVPLQEERFRECFRPSRFPVV